MAQNTSIPGFPQNFQANLPVTATHTTYRPGWATQTGVTPKTINGQ